MSARSKWVRRFATIAVGLFFTCMLLFLSLVIWVNTSHFQRLSTHFLEQNIEDQIGEQATVNGVEIHFFRPGITVHGLHIWNRVTDDTILSAEKVRVPLSLFPLGIGKLSIRNPMLSLHMGPDGKLREFRSIKKGQGQGQPLTKLPWRALDIENGTIKFENPDGKATLSEFNIRPIKGPTSTVSGTLFVSFKKFSDQTKFEWENVLLGPSTLRIPELSLALRAVQMTGSASYTLGQDFNAKLTLQSELHEWNDLLTSPRTLEGAVTMDLTASGTPQEPLVIVDIKANDFQFEAPGKNSPIVRYQIQNIVSTIKANKQYIEISPTPISIGESKATLSARIEPRQGVAPLYKTEWYLQNAQVLSDSLSLKEALRAAGVAPNPWVDMSTIADIQLSGPLKPLDLKGPFVLQGTDFRVGDRRVEDPDVKNSLYLKSALATGHMVLNKEHVVLTIDEVEVGRTRGSGVVDIGFKPHGPLDISVNLAKANFADFGPLGGARLKGTGRLKGRIWGPFTSVQMLGHGSFNNFSSTGIDYADKLTATIRSPDMNSIILERARAIKGETHYGGTIGLYFKPTFALDTHILISKGRIQDMMGMFMDFEGITGEIEGGEINLNGPFQDLDGDADLRTKDVVIFGEKFDRGRAQGQMHTGEFTLSDMRFTRKDNKEGLTLHGSVGREWALNMNLNADLNLSTLSLLGGNKLPLEGHLTSNLRLDNTLFSPAPQGRILVTDMSYGGQPTENSQLRLSTEDGITQIKGTLLGSHVGVDANTNLFDTQSYVADLKLNDFPLHLLYPEGANGEKINATATGYVGIDGTIGGSVSDIGVESRFNELRFEWGSHVILNERPFSYVQNEAGWLLDNLSIISQNSKKTHIQLKALGDGEQTTAEGKGHIDLDLLRVIIPGLSRAEGTGVVRFASKREDQNTQTIVKVLVDAPIIRHDSFPGTLEDVRATISGTESAYIIERFTAGLGGGKIVGTAIENEALSAYLSPTANPSALGVIEAEKWSPTRFTLEGSAENTQVRWTDSLAPAVGNATISFDGPIEQLLLSGQVDILEMNFTDRINWEDWVVEIGADLLAEAPPTDEQGLFAIDIGINADRTIRLLNNVSDAVASADLQIIGDTNRSGMTGLVRVEEGLVYLQDREFKIERADMKFRDPWSWDPELDFDMVTDLDSRRRRYRVHYRVLGPYSNWTTQTTSEPWLSQADVNALLWFGVTSEELEEMGELGTAVGQAAVDLIIQDFILADYLGLLGFQETVAGQLLPEVDLVTGANTRGEYSSDPRIKLTIPGLPPRLKAAVEFNLLRADHYAHVKWTVTPSLSLSGWYASRRREGIRLPADMGAFGSDLLWLHEFD